MLFTAEWWVSGRSSNGRRFVLNFTIDKLSGSNSFHSLEARLAGLEIPVPQE